MLRLLEVSGAVLHDLQVMGDDSVLLLDIDGGQPRRVDRIAAPGQIAEATECQGCEE